MMCLQTVITHNISGRAPPSAACERHALRTLPMRRDVTALRAGHCGETEFGDSDCSEDDSGAWHIRSLHNHSLEGCMARCACCERCRYVSFAPSRGDCSWYHACNLSDGLQDTLEKGTVSIGVHAPPACRYHITSGLSAKGRSAHGRRSRNPNILSNVLRTFRTAFFWKLAYNGSLCAASAPTGLLNGSLCFASAPTRPALLRPTGPALF